VWLTTTVSHKKCLKVEYCANHMCAFWFRASCVYRLQVEHKAEN